jgi:hypothetical protein
MRLERNLFLLIAAIRADYANPEPEPTKPKSTVETETSALSPEDH